MRRNLPLVVLALAGFACWLILFEPGSREVGGPPPRILAPAATPTPPTPHPSSTPAQVTTSDTAGEARRSSDPTPKGGALVSARGKAALELLGPARRVDYPPATLSGVVTLNGKPAAGAQVTLRGQAVQTKHTDAAGRFGFRVAWSDVVYGRPNDPHARSARAVTLECLLEQPGARYFERVTTTLRAGGAAAFAVELYPCHDLELTLSEPLQDTEVRLTHPSALYKKRWKQMTRELRIPLVRAGRYRITVVGWTRRDGLLERRWAEGHVELGSHVRRRVRLRVIRLARVVIRLLDPTGSPVKGLVGLVAPSRGEEGWFMDRWTDSNSAGGGLTFDDEDEEPTWPQVPHSVVVSKEETVSLPPGRWTLIGLGDDPTWHRTEETLVLGAGQVVERPLRLGRSRPVDVRFPNRAVSEQGLMFLLEGPAGISLRLTGAGRLQIHGLREGDTARLVLSGDDLADLALADAVLLRGGQGPATLSPSHTGALRVKVVGPQGSTTESVKLILRAEGARRPLPGAYRLLLNLDDLRPDGGAPVPPRYAEPPAGDGALDFSDVHTQTGPLELDETPDGSLELEGLIPGTYRLQRAGQPAAASDPVVRILAGRRVEAVHVVP